MSRHELVLDNIDRRVEAEAEKIASVLDWWIGQEVISSGSTHNAYLDDFDQFEKELQGAEQGTFNVAVSKATAHYQRLIGWTNDVETASTNPEEFSEDDLDYLLARQLFGVMMLVSGNLRKQALISASSQEEYATYRNDNSLVGLDIHKVVRDRVWWHRAAKQSQPIADEQHNLLQNTLVTNDLSHAWTSDFLYARGSKEPGRNNTETVAAGHIAEQAWVELAVDYIFYMDDRNFELGKSNGYEGFAKVPFLEPKSITLEPGIIYPFSAQHLLKR